MSRSYRKAIIKDKPRNYKASTYYRKIRSVINNIVRSCKDIENLEIPNSKVIVNDYDYSDYKFSYEHDQSDKEQRNKYRRK